MTAHNHPLSQPSPPPRPSLAHWSAHARSARRPALAPWGRPAATLAATALAALALIALAGPAYAQSTGNQTYAAEFEQVTNSCAATEGFQLAKAPLTLGGSDAETTVTVPKLPSMSGSQRRRGKLNASADESDNDGKRMRLKLSGRIVRAQLQLLLIAEFYAKDGSPVCSQSWNVTGQLAKSDK
ncbi:MAG: hypothetical protein Tsb0020_10450 [Haliangiales bacterium]